MADGQFGDGAVGQPARHLHRALAEGAGAHDDRPAAVLEGPGEEFGRAHRAAVDEHDHGSGGVAAASGVQCALLAADVVGGDEAAVEEGGGGGDGLGDQAAGVAAQVEDDPVARGRPGDGGAHLVAGALGEGGDPDHGGPAGDPARGDVLGGQPGPAQGLRPHAAVALEAEGDAGAGGGVPAPAVLGVPAQYGDDLGDGAVVDPLPVDAAQPVPGADAGGGRGGAGADPGDLDAAVALAPGGEPDAGVLAVQGLLELLVLVRGVDGAPAVAAAADGPLRGLQGRGALGHRAGGGPGDLLLPCGDGTARVVRGGSLGRGPARAEALVERAGRGAGHQHAREDQRQRGPAAGAAGRWEERAVGGWHGGESRGRVPGERAVAPPAPLACVTGFLGGCRGLRAGRNRTPAEQGKGGAVALRASGPLLPHRCRDRPPGGRRSRS